MTPIVKITYDSSNRKLSVTYADRPLDVSKIADKTISEWAYPFCIKGVKWNGLYEELRSFVGEDEFTVYFDGSSDDFDVLKNALQDTKAKLVNTNNTVVILYSENPFTTRITVNGAVFDTTRIQNRSIDEWINPICIRELNWNGIFTELADYIGIDIYKIQFSGKQELMKTLIDACPDTVDIVYRTVSKPKPKAVRSQGDNSIANGISNITSKVSLPANAEQIGQKLKQEVTDEEINKNLDKIPIKNDFIRKNAMAICAVISLIVTVFPFFGVSMKTDYSDVNESVRGYEALFGDKHSLISVSLFIFPILIIVMNYIKALKPYRRLIAIIAPCLAVIFEIFTVISLRSALLKGTDATNDIVGTLGVKMETHSTLHIGFWLILLSYVLTGVIGFITYYGLELPNKKK